MKNLVCFIIALSSFLEINAQTIGNTVYEKGNADGYVLFSPLNSTKTVLIDKCGQLVQEWNSQYKPGATAVIGEDGKLYRTGSVDNEKFLNGGGNGGVLEIFSFNGTKEATYNLSSKTEVQHHDIVVLENGNILLTLWEIISYEQCIAKGKDINQLDAIPTKEMWFEKVVEIKPIDSTKYETVWQWRSINHAVQELNGKLINFDSIHLTPGKIDINYNPIDKPAANFIHINNIDYNPALDQILLSSRLFDEVWIIDHSTTTAEAAGSMGGNSKMGGSLLYRWGNPSAYKSGIWENRSLFKQHHAHWVNNNEKHNGNIMIFNNGNGRSPIMYSSIEIIKPPVDGFKYKKVQSEPYEPQAPYYNYVDTNSYYFFASYVSGATFLDNGNLLISDGTNGMAMEMDTNNNLVWEYINPIFENTVSVQGEEPKVSPLFRYKWYALDYKGFQNADITLGAPLELNPISPLLCKRISSVEVVSESAYNVFPNPASSEITVECFNGNLSFDVFNLKGQQIIKQKMDQSSVTFDISSWDKGCYLFVFENGQQKKVLLY